MAITINLVKFIIGVVLLIVIVQILVALHFSSKDWLDEPHNIKGDHIKSSNARILTHVSQLFGSKIKVSHSEILSFTTSG